MIKKIVLISAAAQEGKTSTATIIKKKMEQEGYKCAIVPLAKHLKRLLMDFYGWNGQNKSQCWRDMLQIKGSDVIRDELKMPMFHCQRLCEDVSVIQNEFDIILVDDVRFKNELYYIKSFFVDKTISIKVNRLNFESPLTKQQQNHQSERGMDGFENYNYTITSDNGLQNLERAILESNIINDIIKE